jgi:hypothetical protein
MANADLRCGCDAHNMPNARRSVVRLIGNFLSPYVRRVAVSLHLLELPFELEELFVFKEPDVVRRYNPVVRIPVLKLDDGANLVESGAILMRSTKWLVQSGV